MIATGKSELSDEQRIVITGIGLTSPNGNTLDEYRENLLEGRSGVTDYEIRYVGKTLAGRLRLPNQEVSDAQGRQAWHASRFGGHLLCQRSGRGCGR